MLPFAEIPVLKNELIIARQLLPSDFDSLYAAASDPLIWEQHPNPNRWQKDAFTNYFEGAIQSQGALLVKYAENGEVIGSSRFSDWIPETKTISIGYTFFIRRCWGKGYNYALKKRMLDFVFQYADNVTFYVGAVNTRSQISIERFGAKKIGEKELAYYGEAPKLDFVYLITKEQYLNPL
jgi:RimJ/RimL family protein N-acetyltransferase